jgi:two-component system chemotaxis response regulator CheY
MSVNILIVDDSATMRRMIRRTLQMSGLDIDTVHEAENGIKAFAVLGQSEIDAIILDVNMPVMTGTQFIQRIRDDERLAHIPVVIASTEGSETRIRELMSFGAIGFVRKPFQPEQLREILEPVVGSPTGANEVGFDESDDSAF